MFNSDRKFIENKYHKTSEPFNPYQRMRYHGYDYDKNSDKLPHYSAIYQEGFFRFSVGLEDAEDVIADLKQAMKACGVL